MSIGNLMYYGGMAGVGVSVLLLLACIKIFPKQRKRKLESYE